MPPKSSNKKTPLTASWYHCETCDVHITAKERDDHNCTATPAEYIRNGVLYSCSVERRSFSIEELKDMPARYVNNLVFISEGAMRLAHLHIGQPVQIALGAQEQAQDAGQAPAWTLIRSIWPVPERFLTTIFATEDDYNQNWTSLKGQVLRIEALPNECPLPARNVRVQLVDDRNAGDDFTEKQMQDVQRILKIDMRNLIYTTGSTLYMNFFNKRLKLMVIDWNVVDATPNGECSLEEQLEKLSLSRRAEKFFQVTPCTILEVERNNAHEADEAGSTDANDSISKSDIGGLEQQLSLIEDALESALGFKGVPKGVTISRGMLLYGSTGCGKTMICEALCTAVSARSVGAIKTHIIKIGTGELFSKFLGETEKNLAANFERAFSNYPQPTLIVVEDVHNLCPKHEANEVTKRVTVAFLSLLDSLNHRKEAQRVFLLATTSQIDALNPSIRRCGRLDTEIEIGVPTPKGRTAILECLLSKVEHSLTQAQVEEVAQVTHGFVGADLANLIYRASLHAFKSANGNDNTNTNTNSRVTAGDVHATLLHVKPSAMREVLIESPNVRWSDIGGQEELKLKLKQAIEWPLLHADKFKRLGIKPPRGLLMFGPPGCSKTMIAKALATESQLNFLSIKGPELFSMWVGESERAVREVFRKARQVAPAIVFFDEIDAIGGERSEGGSGGGGSSVKERVLTQLLTELDGVESLQDVTIVAATNRPDMIDKALLRPGRIDRIVYVGLPDAAARHEIFRIKLRAMPLAADVAIDELVARTDGYSGAEIQAVCHEAALKTLEESFEASHVTWQQFEYALNAVQPRTSADLLRLYDDYLKRS